MPEFDDWVRFPILGVLFVLLGFLVWAGKKGIGIMETHVSELTKSNSNHAESNKELAEGVKHLGTVAEVNTTLLREVHKAVTSKE